MTIQNPNCSGGHCRVTTGEVRVYPLGGGGNLILCRACWAHENQYRLERGRETGEPANWPQVDWATAEVYATSESRNDFVTRYVPTYINKDGMRTLMGAAQGRNTFATEGEAQEWITAVTENNSADTLRQIWGDDPQFAVRPCPCWPGHFDPKGVWFD